MTSDHLVFLQAEGVELTAEEVEAVRTVTAETMDLVRSLLPELTPTLNITLYPGRYCDGAGSDAVPFTARAMNADWIRLSADPRAHGGLATNARTNLAASLAHESHHCARMRRFEALAEGRVPLADLLVFEGLATAFERDVSGVTPPWGDYADVPIDEWAGDALAQGDDYDYFHWAFQHPDGRQWIAYRAGTYLADCAIRASGRSAADLVDAPTSEVLALAAEARAG